MRNASAAIAAAVNDSRFQPVGEEELSHITIELSVLTIPEEIDYSSPSDLQKKIKVGKDGLIVEYGPYSGLLLPQVALEWKWDALKLEIMRRLVAQGVPEFSFRDRLYKEFKRIKEDEEELKRIMENENDYEEEESQ